MTSGKIKNNRIKVLMAAVEAAPLIKVGGLADVVGSLPAALNGSDCEVRVIMPLAASIDRKKHQLKKVYSDLPVRSAGRKFSINLWETRRAIKGVRVYLIENARYFSRHNIYEGRETEKFLFFSVAVLESLAVLGWRPDIIHVHDFHTALLPALLRTERYRRYSQVKTLFTIHNLDYQGKDKPMILKVGDLAQDSLSSLARDAADGDINFMVQGLINADLINTVSPNYAREIATAAYGAGLEKIIRRQRRKLSGIVNGLNYEVFNPETDRFIKKRFSARNPGGKTEDKLWLQKRLGLPQGRNIPLAALVSRLTAQKGLDLITEKAIKLPGQFVFLGTGEKRYEKRLKALAKKYPDKVAAVIGFDEALAQQIYAGADIFLMPSRFEPCGLGQMIAMRYGTVPLVRRTGGLADTVNGRNGFVFDGFTSEEFYKALKMAMGVYSADQKKWLKLKENCFKSDFSWKKSAKKYLALYKKLVSGVI